VTKSPILSFGYSQPELMKKHRALCDAGFDVRSVRDLRQAKSLIKKQESKFSVLLVGPLVPDNERAELATLFRKYCPEGKVIYFYWTSISNATEAAALLSEERSPDNLLDAIHIMYRRPHCGNFLA
jgi:hypothetical protein